MRAPCYPRQHSIPKDTMRRIVPLLASSVVALAASASVASAAVAHTPSASTELHAALSLVTAAGSMTVAGSVTTSGAVGGTQMITSTTSTGQQVIVHDGATQSTRVVNGRCFVQFNAKGLLTVFGTSKTTWANKWIEVPKSDPNYASVSSGITLASALKMMTPAAQLSFAASTTVHGTAATAITGKVSQSITGGAKVTGSETLYVATAAPHTPLRLVVHAIGSGKSLTLDFAVSHVGSTSATSSPATSTKISKTGLEG